jgi:hypothetical protein
MNRQTVRTAVVMAMLAGTGASPVAGAEPVCGASVHHAFSGVRTFSRDYSATCQPGSACAVLTHMLNSEAPLGFSHVFGFRRESGDSRWRAVLLDKLEHTNPASGMVVRVDDGEPVNIPAAMITASEDGNAFTFDAQVTELILAAAKPGNRLSVSYTATNGESLSASFSLIGLTNALEWSACAQGILVSGKSDAGPRQSDEDEEFSGPEPGVPIAPDDSQD